MKRIAFCLLWLFLTLPVQAQEYDYCAGAGGAAAACTTSNDSLIYDGSGTPTLSNAEAYMATRIVLASNTTVTEYMANACRTAEASENYTIGLWTDSSTEPGSAIADTSTTIANGDMTTQYTYSDETVALSTPKLVTAQTVWLVVTAASSKFRWGKMSETGGKICYSTTGEPGSWTCDANRRYVSKLSGCN